MSDRRITPNPALVDRRTPAQVAVPVVDLLNQPTGARDRQLVFGDPVKILGATGDSSYIVSEKDGYVGFVPSSALTDRKSATHRVTAPATHVYARADIKSPDLLTLSFGSRIEAKGETRDFVETSKGFVPKVHLAATGTIEPDIVGVAQKFLGVPYLWGGNSVFGIDCSGLVQAALLACGVDCPGDSDQQCDALGYTLTEGSNVERADLFFWPGHVALALDAETLIHANAFHMAVACEPLSQALSRIEAAGDGPIQAHKRL